MKTTIPAAAALVICLMASSAFSGPIERACNKSSRDAANRQVCLCIQSVADQILNSTDQRRAAKLLNNPEKAHEVWQSQRPADDAFWERYKVFGVQVETSCAAG
jgi:hypothetical protein